MKIQFETDFGLENMRVVFRDGSFADNVLGTLDILRKCCMKIKNRF